jgi:hypothetical protein
LSQELDPPASIALPYVSQRNIPSREPVVMAMIGSDDVGENSPWVAVATHEVVFDDIKVIITLRSELHFEPVGNCSSIEQH